MKWFKFYGQDFFSDPKVMLLSPAQKLMFIGLMSLAAAEDKTNEAAGVIPMLTESTIMLHIGISPDTESYNECYDIFNYFKELGFIKVDKKRKKIVVVNYKKLQKTNLSASERVVQSRLKKSKQNVSSVNKKFTLDKDKDKDKDIYNNIVAHDEQPTEKTVKAYERKPLEKQSQLQRICYHLEDALNTNITNWGKQAKGLDMMLKAGYTEDQIKKAINYMANKDEFFADKGFDLMTVANTIPRLKAMASKGKQQ